MHNWSANDSLMELLVMGDAFKANNFILFLVVLYFSMISNGNLILVTESKLQAIDCCDSIFWICPTKQEAQE